MWVQNTECWHQKGIRGLVICAAAASLGTRALHPGSPLRSTSLDSSSQGQKLLTTGKLYDRIKKMNTSFEARQSQIQSPSLPLNISVTRDSYLTFLLLQVLIYKRKPPSWVPGSIEIQSTGHLPCNCSPSPKG